MPRLLIAAALTLSLSSSVVGQEVARLRSASVDTWIVIVVLVVLIGLIGVASFLGSGRSDKN